MSESTETSEKVDIVIKSSSDKKYNVSIESTATVQQLKGILAGQSDIPVERQRLIFAGRVLKDNETIGSYKIKSGQTVHLVKGAAPGGTSSSAAVSSSNSTASSAAAPAAPAAPRNIAAGQGTGNVLADLTGARYAGLAQLPSASMFGPDGGMGPAPSREDIISMMETPGFAESMQQTLQNPQIMDFIINSNPAMRQMGPQFRQMFQNPEFRNLLTNPQLMRQMMEMERAFGGALGGGGGGSDGQSAFPAPGGAGSSETGDSSTAISEATGTESNPGSNSAAGSTGNAANPFAALFANPNGQQNAWPNPALLGSLLQGGNFNPPPEDSRPPEERYETQLRQLNELGFVDFDRNVQALRRSGGNVQGAVEALLDGQV
jgi:ubiquilin